MRSPSTRSVRAVLAGSALLPGSVAATPVLFHASAGAEDHVADEGDNQHPSGKDRSVEPSGSDTQGHAQSDPDDDFEDDNEGRCLGRQGPPEEPPEEPPENQQVDEEPTGEGPVDNEPTDNEPVAYEDAWTEWAEGDDGHVVITVVPVSSNTARVHPFQVLLDADETGLPRDSKAQAEQIHSVAIERVGAKVGRLTSAQLAALDEALRLHLAL